MHGVRHGIPKKNPYKQRTSLGAFSTIPGRVCSAASCLATRLWLSALNPSLKHSLEGGVCMIRFASIHSSILSFLLCFI